MKRFVVKFGKKLGLQIQLQVTIIPDDDEACLIRMHFFLRLERKRKQMYIVIKSSTTLEAF